MTCRGSDINLFYKDDLPTAQVDDFVIRICNESCFYMTGNCNLSVFEIQYSANFPNCISRRNKDIP